MSYHIIFLFLSSVTSLESSIAIGQRQNVNQTHNGSSSLTPNKPHPNNKIILLHHQPPTEPSDTTKQWHPSPALPVPRSDHPFDKCCNMEDLTKLRSCCNQSLIDIFVHLQRNNGEFILTRHLHDLLSPNNPINQQIININLELFSHHFKIKFLDTSFFSKLHQEGWQSVTTWFRSHRTCHSQRPNTPQLSGDPAITIPCHINGNHWVMVTRREILGQVIFLYANDLNNTTTENRVKNTLSSANQIFYPPTAIWMIHIFPS
jgi:hypothetical protein